MHNIFRIRGRLHQRITYHHYIYNNIPPLYAKLYSKRHNNVIIHVAEFTVVIAQLMRIRSSYCYCEQEESTTQTTPMCGLVLKYL